LFIAKKTSENRKALGGNTWVQVQLYFQCL
jgi:hypothetical protein